MWEMILWVVLVPNNFVLEVPVNPAFPNNPNPGYTVSLVDDANGTDPNTLRISVTGFASKAECACFMTDPLLGCNSPVHLTPWYVNGVELTVTTWSCSKVP